MIKNVSRDKSWLANVLACEFIIIGIIMMPEDPNFQQGINHTLIMLV